MEGITTNTPIRKVGRPKKYNTEEERLEALKEVHKKLYHKHYEILKPLKQLKKDLDQPEVCMKNFFKILLHDKWNDEIEQYIDQRVKEVYMYIYSVNTAEM